jgi:hypothetical protein
VRAAHVQACEEGSAQPDDAILVAWSTVLGCRVDQLRSTSPDDPAEYWHAANQAMPPMSGEDLAVVAQVFTRTARDNQPGS